MEAVILGIVMVMVSVIVNAEILNAIARLIANRRDLRLGRMALIKKVNKIDYG
jgi:hypothetical protein